MPIFRAGEAIQLDARARSPENTQIEPDPEFLRVRQSIVIDDEISEYQISGRIDVARSGQERRAVFLLDAVGAQAP